MCSPSNPPLLPLVQDLMLDFKQLISNCKAYNPPGNDWHEIAEEFMGLAIDIENEVMLGLIADAVRLKLRKQKTQKLVVD